MIQFSEKDAKLAHLNIRDEKHGEETVLACDIKIQIDMPNTALDSISDGLRLSLYGAEDKAQELFDDGHLPRLRHSCIEPLKIVLEETPVRLVFDRVTKSVQVDGTVKRVTIECKEGGTVTFTFSVAATPDPDVIGTLSGMLGNSHTTTLTLISKPKQEDEQFEQSAGEETGEGQEGEEGEPPAQRRRGRRRNGSPDLPGVVQ